MIRFVVGWWDREAEEVAGLIEDIARARAQVRALQAEVRELMTLIADLGHKARFEHSEAKARPAVVDATVKRPGFIGKWVMK